MGSPLGRIEKSIKGTKIQLATCNMVIWIFFLNKLSSKLLI